MAEEQVVLERPPPSDRLDQMRQVAAKYLRPLFSWTAAISAAFINLLQASQVVNLPPVIVQLVIPASVLASIFVLYRFPRVYIAVTRILVPPPKPIPNLPRMFRGLRPYNQGETLPGRQRDIDACWAVLNETAFVILEGESGCGKSSLLNTALLLRARDVYRVVECRIAEDPFGKLYAALRHAPYRNVDAAIDATTLSNAILQAAHSNGNSSADTPAPGNPLLLCIDQCEELFVTVKDVVRRQFLAVLKDAVAAGHLRLLMAIRNDFRDLLYDHCRTVDPEQQTFNLGNVVKVESFHQEQAEAVIQEILQPARGNDAWRQQQLDEFARLLTQELLRAPRDQRLCPDDEKIVLPAELQTVGAIIEDYGTGYFSAAGFNRLGGKAGLLRRYIDQAKEHVLRRTGVLDKQALAILRQLITSAGTKKAWTAQAVATELHMKIDLVQQVLDAFAEKFLVNRLPVETTTDDPDSNRPAQGYELMHEHLIQILDEAPDPILQRERDAEERLRFWMDRTKAAFTPKSPRSVWSRVRSMLAQPIPFIESWRLWPFARSDDARRMLRRNLRGFCCRFTPCVLMLLVVLSYPYAWYIQNTRNMGELQIDNPTGAALTLRCIRHYGDKAPCPPDGVIPVKGRSVYLPGPTDYMLAAQHGNDWTVKYPVYIHGYKHQIPVAVHAPPADLPEGMVYIPGGVFRMGDKDDKDGRGYGDERPHHDVDVDTFVIDRFEVTTEEYQVFIDAGGYAKQKYWQTQDGWAFIQGEGHTQPSNWTEQMRHPKQPVASVSWYEANAYCQWRKDHSEGYKVRLPTEAEWEKAASGPEGYLWSFGNTLSEKDSKVKDEGTKTGTDCVDKYPPNSYGLCAMGGSVLEWVQDWYDETFYRKPEATQRNPVNRTERGGLRVVRGGSWFFLAVNLRVAFRFRGRPDVRFSSTGFRCAASPPPQ